MEVSLSFWVVFHLVVAVFLAIDLIYWEKRKGEIRFRDSLLWVIAWISLGLSFSVIVFSMYGTEEFIKYITAYIAEYSLSTDNLFVFLVIFTYFAVPPRGRHIVLLAGIICAAVFRGTFIFVGVALLERFHWMVYVFGAVLIYTGYKMARGGGEAVDPGKNRVVNFARKFLPIAPTYGEDGKSFIIKQNGDVLFTPLLLTLLAVETTDIMFAFDSVPAVLAITREFFTAYTSNIMAVLGLRSLYFLLEHGLRLVENLGRGLAIYLIYLGAAFILSAFGIEVPSYISLLLIATIILVLVLMARLRRKESGTAE
ncbi:TerC/Alx family metal homeostasis membrane protein [Candidatus Methanodesulfokora washburnensis]|jgi:tellurite resistance protein TerC|uniref:TerC/Alx family metal homeostasis membrane protein n=1 Tax=Candidatus Methanodesulfokora washburnensis TaxID=2478471 RepID=A0A429GRM7_9CREN|nr:TerC/Alx family metal homeostasis membrane protein [Candidatus Methanodesulfokores washburnensis]RSN76495.1 TerC/Alx family metal homeostasis membrane protein [Candidatus Methanodesulfokores washburnensis]